MRQEICSGSAAAEVNEGGALLVVTGCHVASRRPALDCDDEAQKPLVNRFEAMRADECCKCGEAALCSCFPKDEGAPGVDPSSRTLAAMEWCTWNEISLSTLTQFVIHAVYECVACSVSPERPSIVSEINHIGIPKAIKVRLVKR